MKQWGLAVACGFAAFAIANSVRAQNAPPTTAPAGLQSLNDDKLIAEFFAAHAPDPEAEGDAA